MMTNIQIPLKKAQQTDSFLLPSQNEKLKAKYDRYSDFQPVITPSPKPKIEQKEPSNLQLNANAMEFIPNQCIIAPNIQTSANCNLNPYMTAPQVPLQPII